MGLKAGLNQNDINRARKMLEAGNSVEEIARACKVKPEAMARYIDSLEAKPKKVAKKTATKKADADEN